MDGIMRKDTTQNSYLQQNGYLQELVNDRNFDFASIMALVIGRNLA